MNQLALQTLTNVSTVSEVASRLVSTGYVKRLSHVSDGRRIHLSLSARGVAALRGSPQPVQDKLANALVSLSKPKLARLADAFEEWVSEARLQRTAPTLLSAVSKADE